jgi:hypothetical protein
VPTQAATHKEGTAGAHATAAATGWAVAPVWSR